MLRVTGFALLATPLFATLLGSRFTDRARQEIGRQSAEPAIRANDKFDHSQSERQREFQLLAGVAELMKGSARQR